LSRGEDVPLTPDALTDAIESAYEKEWKKKKSNPLPDAGKDDRRLLFAGVARGILEYLAANPTQILTSIKAADDAGVAYSLQVSETDWNINAG
jgi:hypothetical protein